jgi:hypothetical protein
VNQTRSLLILSSGEVSRNLVGELGPISTSNIPLPGGLFLDNLLKQTAVHYEKIYCTLDQSKVALGRILEAKYENLNIHYGDYRMSIAETVFAVLSKTSENFSMIDIVYGDTFSTSLFEDTSEADFILVAHSDGSDEWDHVNRNEMEELTFSDLDIEMKSFCMTGSFRIMDPKLFMNALKKSIAKKEEALGISRNSREFHLALGIYDSELATPFQLKMDLTWKDLGHRRTYFRQRRLYISNGTRIFNSLEFDLKAGWVTKSGNAEKITAEINWYESLPTSLQHYVPGIKSLNVTNQYAIEYIPSIPLNEHWISENPNRDFWIDLLSSLEEMLDNFSNYKEEISLDEIKRLKKFVYVEKVKARHIELMEMIHKTSETKNSKLHEVDLKSTVTRSLDKVLSAGELVSDLIYWNLIHGDLCFSNIIYDQITDNPKLIDPRGSFGEIGIFGDPVYELLKLSQCVLGDYDYLAANLYSLDVTEAGITLDIPTSRAHDWFKSLFTEFLNRRLTKFGLDFKTFRTLEAGLFLSAAPLHSENDRWLALTVQANRILKDLE